jgi:invasion protein IalB
MAYRTRLSSRRLTICLSLPLATAALLAMAASARAAEGDDIDSRQEPSLEGLYGDWSLYGLQENGNVVCYLSSGLERSSDDVPRRGPARILITNRPAEGKKGVVSVDPGYTYEDGSTVLMSIGRKQFHLFAAGNAAWAQDSEDAQVIAAIRGGSTLVVTGRMKNGPGTTDVFSLKGFGPALIALDRACPMGGPAIPPPHRKRKKRP